MSDEGEFFDEGMFVRAWVDIRLVENTRDAWFQAECGRCSWTTTGSEPVCEDAAYAHATDVHRKFGWPAPLLEQGSRGEYFKPMEYLKPPTLVALPDIPEIGAHPATMDVGWRPYGQTDRLRGILLGDIIDLLDSVGYEIRIQVRQRKE